MTHDDGKSTQHECQVIQNLQNVVERAVILTKSPSVSSQTDTMVLWTFSHGMAHPRVMECRRERTKIGSFAKLYESQLRAT